MRCTEDSFLCLRLLSADWDLCLSTSKIPSIFWCSGVVDVKIEKACAVLQSYCAFEWSTLVLK